jgi:uncharacterized protein YbaA (DUF1428 family)
MRFIHGLTAAPRAGVASCDFIGLSRGVVSEWSVAMNYIDGFVVPVPSDRKEEYRALCVQAAQVFKDYGAIRVVECWGEDVPAGQVTDFRRAVQAQPGETVVFSWIVWPSKAVRDDGNARALKDPRMSPPGGDMPFDARRMIYGGFEVLADV